MGATAKYQDESLELVGGNWEEPKEILDLGNSGTSIRLLSGLIAGKAGWQVTMTGDSSLRKRPMKRIKEPLELMGAKIDLLGDALTPPIKITGANLKAINYISPVASAQVKSCVLLAALFAEGKTTYHEKFNTRNHTELIFKELGLPIELNSTKITIEGFGAKGPSLKAREWKVPGDFSSAAFWIIAGLIVKRSHIIIKEVGLNPMRTALLDVLASAHANINIKQYEDSMYSEPTGEIEVKSSELEAFNIGGAQIPNLIDEIPILSVAATAANGISTIKDATELRIKESDRITSMVKNLSVFGFEVEELADGMIIKGKDTKETREVELDCFYDHRIAMSMAILALAGKAPVTIKNVECVDTSYPSFWDDLRRLGGNVLLHYSN